MKCPVTDANSQFGKSTYYSNNFRGWRCHIFIYIDSIGNLILRLSCFEIYLLFNWVCFFRTYSIQSVQNTLWGLHSRESGIRNHSKAETLLDWSSESDWHTHLSVSDMSREDNTFHWCDSQSKYKITKKKKALNKQPNQGLGRHAKLESRATARMKGVKWKLERCKASVSGEAYTEIGGRQIAKHARFRDETNKTKLKHKPFIFSRMNF